MRSGYAFELDGSDWQYSKNDDWDTVVYTPLGSERLVGGRVIDGSVCKVYSCADGKYRAQVSV